jgi:uncharacterized membrane protein HdeD (DUF308 family)
MLLTHHQRRLRLQRIMRMARPVVRPPSVWWVALLRAFAAVVFGVLAILWPRHTVLAVLTVFGVYALVDGFAAILVSTRGAGLRRRWWLTLSGAVSMVAGFFALTQPRTTAFVLVGVMGAWLILRGVTELLGSMSMRRESGRVSAQDLAGIVSLRHAGRLDWTLRVNAAMSALFGVALIATPKVGALAFVWAIGAWAVMHGLLMIPFALSLRHVPAETGGRGA